MNVLDKGVKETVDRVCEVLCLGLMDKSADREERTVKFVPDLPAPFMTPSTIVVCCQGLMNSIKLFKERKADVQMSVGMLVPDLKHYEVRAAGELSKVLKPDWVPQAETIDIWQKICNEGVTMRRDRLNTALTNRTDIEITEGEVTVSISKWISPNDGGEDIDITSRRDMRNILIPMWTERMLLLAIVNLAYKSVMMVSLHHATQEDEDLYDEHSQLIVHAIGEVMDEWYPEGKELGKYAQGMTVRAST